MSKSFKLASAVLSTGLLITPILGLINYEAKANESIESIQKETDSIYKILEPNVIINNGKISLINRDTIKNQIINNWEKLKIEINFNSPEELFNNIEEHFNNLEYKSQKNLITIKEDGQIIENKKRLKREVWPEHVGRVFSDPNYHVQNHWWGTLHFLYTDEVSYRYAYYITNVAITNSTVSYFTIYTPIGIALNLDANKCYRIANEVNYNANLSGNGVELAVKHWGEVNCKPR